MFGGWGREVRAKQVKFLAGEQFPLDFLARFQSDSSGQRQGKVHVQPRLLTLGADGLHFERICCLHWCKLVYRLTLVDAFMTDCRSVAGSGKEG